MTTQALNRSAFPAPALRPASHPSPFFLQIPLFPSAPSSSLPRSVISRMAGKRISQPRLPGVPPMLPSRSSITCRASSTALKEGTTNIIAALGSVSGTTPLAVTHVLRSLAIIPANPSVAIGKSVQLTAMGTYSDSTVQNLTTSVLWSSSPVNVASISNSAGTQGLATGISSGRRPHPRYFGLHHHFHESRREPRCNPLLHYRLASVRGHTPRQDRPVHCHR